MKQVTEIDRCTLENELNAIWRASIQDQNQKFEYLAVECMQRHLRLSERSRTSRLVLLTFLEIEGMRSENILAEFIAVAQGYVLAIPTDSPVEYPGLVVRCHSDNRYMIMDFVIGIGAEFLWLGAKNDYEDYGISQFRWEERKSWLERWLPEATPYISRWQMTLLTYHFSPKMKNTLRNFT